MEIQRQADQWSLPDRQASHSYDIEDVRDMLGGPRIHAGLLNTREAAKQHVADADFRYPGGYGGKKDYHVEYEGSDGKRYKDTINANDIDSAVARWRHFNVDGNRIFNVKEAVSKETPMGDLNMSPRKMNQMAIQKAPKPPKPKAIMPDDTGMDQSFVPKTQVQAGIRRYADETEDKNKNKAPSQGGSYFKNWGDALGDIGNAFSGSPGTDNKSPASGGSYTQNWKDSLGDIGKAFSSNPGGGSETKPTTPKNPEKPENLLGGDGSFETATPTKNVNNVTPIPASGGGGQNPSGTGGSGSGAGGGSSSGGTSSGGSSSGGSGGGSSAPGGSGSTWSLNTDSSKIGPGTYHIQEGDTLSNIAERAGLGKDNYQQLADSNKISNPDFIRAGDDIQIPGGSTSGTTPSPTPTPSATPDTPSAGAPPIGGDLSGPASGPAPAPAEPAPAPGAPLAAEAAPALVPGLAPIHGSYDPPTPPRDQLRQFISGRRYTLNEPPLPPRDQLRQFMAGKRYILADEDETKKKFNPNDPALTNPGLTPPTKPTSTVGDAMSKPGFSPEEMKARAANPGSSSAPSSSPSQPNLGQTDGRGNLVRQTFPSSQARSTTDTAEAPVRTNDLAGSSAGDSSGGAIRGGNPAQGGTTGNPSSMVSQSPSSQRDNDKQTGGAYGLSDSWSNKGGINGGDLLGLAQPLIGMGTGMLTNIGGGIASGVGNFASELGSGLGSAIGQGVGGLLHH